MIFEAMGNLKDTEESCLEAIKLGENLISLGTLGVVYGKQGRRAEAENVLQQLEARRQQQYTSPYHFAIVHAALKNYDEAFHFLEQALNDRAEWIPHSVVDFRIRELHQHPKFLSIVERAGI